MTRFTSKKDWRRARVINGRFGPTERPHTHLKIVNLPCDNQEKHDALNDRPPLDTSIRGLGSVPVSPFSNQDVLLLIFYGFKVVCERADLSFDRGNDIYNG